MNGKRKEDLSPARIKLHDVRMKIARLSSMIIEKNIEDFGFSASEVWNFTDIREDLVTLKEWTDHNLSVVDGYLGRSTKRRIIDNMRKTNGRSPIEAETYAQKADQLERELVDERTGVKVTLKPAPATVVPVPIDYVVDERGVIHIDGIPLYGGWGYGGILPPLEEPERLVHCSSCQKEKPLTYKHFRHRKNTGYKESGEAAPKNNLCLWRLQCRLCSEEKESVRRYEISPAPLLDSGA